MAFTSNLLTAPTLSTTNNQGTGNSLYLPTLQTTTRSFFVNNLPVPSKTFNYTALNTNELLATLLQQLKPMESLLNENSYQDDDYVYISLNNLPNLDLTTATGTAIVVALFLNIGKTAQSQFVSFNKQTEYENNGNVITEFILRIGKKQEDDLQQSITKLTPKTI